MTVRLVEMDADGNPVQSWLFPYVEDAIAFCEKERGEKLVELDTQLGYQLMTADEQMRMRDGYPERWYEIIGVDNNSEDREIEAGDHRD